MKKRGAIALPIAALVLIILSLLLTVIGVLLIYTFLGSAKEVFYSADSQIRERINDLFATSSDLVVLPYHTANLARGDEHVFSVGIRNNNISTQEFQLRVISVKSIFAEESAEAAAVNISSWVLYPSTITIKGREHAVVGIHTMVPRIAPKGIYMFKVEVRTSAGQPYGIAPRFYAAVESDGLPAGEFSKEYNAGYEAEPYEDGGEEQEMAAEEQVAEEGSSTQDCLNDLSCDHYFIYLPLGSWEHQELFDAKVLERDLFFREISEFKFKNAGTVIVSLTHVKQCDLKRINPLSATDHLKIKHCADTYADSLGIDYERAIGLAQVFGGGKSFFNARSAYATLGFPGQQKVESPSIVAHELGHTYSLCDEYSFPIYQVQNRYFGFETCKNSFPTHCPESSKDCPGNTPPHRDYQGDDVLNVCEGKTHYSVMGFSTGAECGYDATGGYTAVGEGS